MFLKAGLHLHRRLSARRNAAGAVKLLQEYSQCALKFGYRICCCEDGGNEFLPNAVARMTFVDAMLAYPSSHVPQLMLLVKGPLYFISNGPTLDTCRRLSDHFCLLLRLGPKPCLAALVLTLSP
jgi:hypothetical protein